MNDPDRPQPQNVDGGDVPDGNDTESSTSSASRSRQSSLAMAMDNNDDVADVAVVDAAPDDQAIAQFVDVTGATEEQARDLLTATHGNLQTAVQNFFALQDGAGEVNRGRNENESDEDEQQIGVQNARNQAAEQQMDGLRRRFLHENIDGGGVNRGLANFDGFRRVGPPVRAHRPQSWSEWLWGLVMLPVRFGYYSIYGLYQFFMMFFRGPQAINSAAAAQNARADVASFITRFNQEYNCEHPVFTEMTYAELLRECKRELRFGVIYLHSWTHVDSAQFCTQTIGSEAFRALLTRTNALFWACDVQSGEGRRVSQAIRETTYPSLSLICYRDSRMAIVARIQGAHDSATVVEALAQSIDQNDIYMATARNERRAQEQDTLLRREQEQAYEDVLRQDQQRQAEQNLQKEREREEQEKIQKEQDRLKRIEMDLAQLRAQFKESFSQESEPKAGEPDTATVSFRYPNGQRSQRTFHTHNTLTTLYNFAFTHESCPNHFSLWSSMPRKALTGKPDWTKQFESNTSTQTEHANTDNAHTDDDGDTTVTIGQANLNRAVILVQDDSA